MPNYAVIDLGSNSIRLVVYDVKDAHKRTCTNKDFKSLINDKVMAGLSAYVVDGVFTQDGIDRAVSVLRGHAKRARYFDCEKMEVFATAVIRNALNCEEAVAAIEEVGGRAVAIQADLLEREVARRMSENLLIQELSVRALACLSEARDNETGLHIVRTQTYVELLAQHLLGNPAFQPALDNGRLQMVVKAAPLHDIGKVGVPDSILLKPGRLTPEEFSIMKSHPVIGADAITKAMEQALSGVAPGGAEQATGAFRFLEIAREISLGHHEKWDGSGYPAGLAGEAIPVSARLMALADVFDALMTRRVYKPPFSLEETSRIICEGRGSHFDPAVVDAFLVVCGGIKEPPPVGLPLLPAELEPGMVLARDFLSRDGILLLAADYVLDENLIRQIREYEKSEFGGRITLHIHPPKIVDHE